MGIGLSCILTFFSVYFHPLLLLLLNLRALWMQRDVPLVCVYLPSLKMLSWVHYERYNVPKPG